MTHGHTVESLATRPGVELRPEWCAHCGRLYGYVPVGIRRLLKSLCLECVAKYTKAAELPK